MQDLVHHVLRIADDANTVASVEAHGQGGVGKTTACLILDYSPEILERVQSLMWINLGDKATIDSVDRKLAQQVECTSGTNVAMGMRTRDIFKEVIFKEVIADATQWFSRRPEGSKLLATDYR